MFLQLLEYLPAFAGGATVTVAISAAAIALGFCGGIVLHILRESGSPTAYRLTQLFVSFFRGTPMLVQLLMTFYIPPTLGLELNPYVAAVLALGLNSSAYQSEILRAGFNAISKGQVEAAQIMGLSKFQTLTKIQVPQVLRRTLPSLLSETADIVKGSAIVSVIAVTDTLRVANQLVSITYRPLEMFVIAALFYLASISIIQWGGHFAESAWKRKS